jgi:hypothetical protein
MPDKRVDEPGYADELAADTVTSVMAPFVGQGLFEAVAAPARLLGRGMGKGLSLFMSKTAKDPDTGRAWLNWAKDSQRYKKIENPQQAVSDLYDDMTGALKSIEEARNVGRVSAKEAQDGYKDLSRHVENILVSIKNRADELKLPPGGTAQKIEEQLKNFKMHFFGGVTPDGVQVDGLYDKAYKAMPSEELWKQAPKRFGIPIKQYFDSMMTSVKKNTEGIVHPEVGTLEAQARSLFDFHVQKMADDAVQAGKMTTGAAEFFKSHPEIVIDPSKFKNIPRIKTMTGTKEAPVMGEIVDVGGRRVPTSEIKDGYQFISHVNPQAMRKYTSTLFKLSDGFGSEKDIAEGAGNFLTSETGRKIAGDWRRGFLESLSDANKYPAFKDFAKLNKEAFELNDTFLKPLEDRFTIKRVSREDTTRTLMGIAGDFEPQMMNSLKAMSRYGNNNDQTLIGLAERIGSAKKAASEIGRMDTETAIKTMYELGELQTEATKVLSQMDPITRNQFSHLEAKVLEAGDQQSIWKKLAKDAEEFATKNKSALSMSYSGVETALKKLAGNRKSFTANPDQRSIAADGIRNIQTFMNSGDENAANTALDQINRLREISLMSKRVVTGSRQTMQAAAIGKVTGTMLRAVGFNVDDNLTAATGAVMNKFADEFTSKKWTSVTPYLIGKMMESKILHHQNTLGKGLLSGQIARALGADDYMLNFVSGSPEAMKVIEIIKADNKLTPVEKHKAIKKINEDGIKL